MMAKSDVKIRKFYGDSSTKRLDKTWEQKKIKLERCANDFSQNPIIPTRHLRIDDPVPIFETFPRQQMAFDYLRSCQQDVHVFAREKDCDGKRVYIVATLPQFWFKYTRECLPENRNYYEVIPEGAACRLYFDLEFKCELNPGKDGAKMVETFIKYVCHHLKDMYDVNCGRKFVIDLDSSTPAKFSRHLIFHLPGAVFKDNIHAGNFVRHVCTLLERKLGLGSEMPKNKNMLTHVDCDTDNHLPASQDELSMENVHVRADDGESTGDGEDESFASVDLQELGELIIKDGKGGFGTFCDQGVYTKNRNFRIFKSTKIGRNSHLLLSSQNTFKPSFKDRKGSFSKDPDYLLFLDSLISNVSMQVGGKDVKVLTCDSCAKSSKRTCQKESEYSASPPSSQSGNEHSPYPEIDKFISQIINKGGVQGDIRRWVFFPQGKLLTYDILKNRWCENIGRPHRSNHIMMVADLRLGVYYQKCHDPDCKNIDYRSPSRSINLQCDLSWNKSSLKRFFDPTPNDLAPTLTKSDKPIPEDINPLSSAQFVSDDCDDQELCNLAAEFEDGECNHRSSDSFNSERKEISHTNGEYTTSTGNKETTQCDFDWDDEWDKEPFLDVQIQHVRDVSEGAGTKCLLRQDKRTQVGVRQENKEGTRGNGEPFENCSKEPSTLNEAEPTAIKRVCNQVIDASAGHPRRKDEPKPCESCGQLSLKTCCSCENNQLAAAVDEDVCDWLEEDSISDLELSFAAEEVESTTYQ